MAQCPLLPWYIILDFRFKPERSIVSVRQWIYIQGSTGIRQWLINWCTSLMIIHNSISFVDYNEWLKRLEPIHQNSIKVPKLLRQPIRYLYYKTLGTSVKNSPMSPPSLIYNIPSNFHATQHNFLSVFFFDFFWSVCILTQFFWNSKIILITWMSHQIFIYSNKLILAAG